ncbi:MAG TPA: hypothetical protein VEW95_09425 [Candidatus Limnocylindrales bacterium]|nr:hypothetical protein [Candidatus Limnocylindrales bacterium]
MEYLVTDWRGHPNTHCPFCPFAIVSDNAAALLDHHVSKHHPVQLREAMAAEMSSELADTRKAMNKEQLLTYATDELGIEGLTTRTNRDQIEAAIAAKHSEAAAGALTPPKES